MAVDSVIVAVFFFQAEDGIRDKLVTGVQTCAFRSVGMPVAGSILLASGIHAQVFGVLLGGRAGWFLGVALTLFLVVGVTAAFSILGPIGGLFAGAAAVGALLFSALAGVDRPELPKNFFAAPLWGAPRVLPR